MIIVDTSVWIDYLKGSPEITSILNQLLQKRQVMAISVIFGELLQGVRNRREREVVYGFWNNLPKMDESNLFIEAGNLSGKNKLFSTGVGLIACYILSASIREDLDIWTFDKKLEGIIDNLIID